MVATAQYKTQSLRLKHSLYQMLQSVQKNINKANFLSENIIWLGCLFGWTLSPISVIPQGETKPDLYRSIIGYMARESNNHRTPVVAQCGRTVSYIYVDTSCSNVFLMMIMTQAQLLQNIVAYHVIIGIQPSSETSNKPSVLIYTSCKQHNFVTYLQNL
jgi:hypothetical protein